MTDKNTFSTEQNQLHYHISVADIKQHLYQVKLRIERPSVEQRIYLPVWIAGSYLVREFAKHLQLLQASQNGSSVELRQLDKHQWQLECSADAPLEISYQVYALDNSVRSAWLDSSRAFFNGTSVFLAVQGMEDSPLSLSIAGFDAIAGAKVATALRANAVDSAGFGRYQAINYQQLVDSPVEISAFEQSKFELAGVVHHIIVAGATVNFDLARLTADVAKICHSQMQLWQPSKTQLPMAEYYFLLNVVGQGYGGLEHRNSTALICSRNNLPSIGAATTTKNYQTLLGLFSHEYFHSWNVKRLRPFTNINHHAENYTELLWFFEGVTSYYDDLCLYRSGCISASDYLQILEQNIHRVQQTPGRKIHSLAQASFEAWTKFYRPDENTLNATVSYYVKGAVLALCLDLTLRQQHGSSLDALLQQLWQQHADAAISYHDILAALKQITATDFKQLMDTWVYGCDELPVLELLQQQGVELELTKATPEQQLGLELQATKNNALLKVKAVLTDGYAQQAGVSPGDEIIAINNWRITNLADLTLYLKPSATSLSVPLLLARDAKVHQLSLTIPASLLNQAKTTLEPATGVSPAQQLGLSYKLKIANETKIKHWIT